MATIMTPKLTGIQAYGTLLQGIPLLGNPLITSSSTLFFPTSDTKGMARGRGSGGGIHLTVDSVPIFFAILYGIMLLQFIRRVLGNPSQVFFSLLLFCAIRVSAFVIYRIILTASDIGNLAGLAITTKVLFNVGFFALLYAAYMLVLDREIASGKVVKNPISRVTSNRYLICFALAVAVSIGIPTFVCFSRWDMSYLALRETYTTIFLAVTILMGVQTVFQVSAERAVLKRGRSSSGRVYMYIPCLFLILLLIHEIYDIVTIHLYGTEALWWTLFALPELLAVFLFALPDLVPKKECLASRAQGQELDGCGEDRARL